MCPSVFSSMHWKTANKGWNSAEVFNVNYCSNPFNQTVNNTLKDKYLDKFWPVGKNGKKLKSSNEGSHNPRAKKLFALTFSYRWKYNDDDVFFAFSIPYSYHQLNKFIDGIMDEAEKL